MGTRAAERSRIYNVQLSFLGTEAELVKTGLKWYCEPDLIVANVIRTICM